MQEKQPWLGDQAFGDEAGALVTVTYKSHQDALRFLLSVLDDPRGAALLQGPPDSGKTTVARCLSEKLPADTAVAVVDGNHIKPRELLCRMLSQFGYETGLESTEELSKMMRVFAIQQTRSWQPLILIIDNVDRMYPSSLAILSTLAALTVQDRYAIRIIATGGSGLTSLIESDGMAAFAKRIVGNFVLRPLSLGEALLYLHARLGACGVNNADTVFPVDVCDRLYKQSAGWPGLMNRYAREAIERAARFPLRVTDTYAKKAAGRDTVPETAAQIPVLDVDKLAPPLPPSLIISRDGELLSDTQLTQKKLLVGRSDFADIVINDDFVSKLHLVLLMFSDALVLLDLNSANGVTVNSIKVKSTVLKTDDIITLGHHRLKVRNAPAISDEIEKILTSPDTLRMKNLVDSRRHAAQQRARAGTGKKTQG